MSVMLLPRAAEPAAISLARCFPLARRAERLREFLPAYSPELQPAERLWSLTNEGVANPLFATLAALEDAVTARLQVLMAQPAVVRAYTYYHWWPAAA